MLKSKRWNNKLIFKDIKTNGTKNGFNYIPMELMYTQEKVFDYVDDIPPKPDTYGIYHVMPQ